MVERERPDVLLLDVRMPKRNGLEVLAALHAHGWCPPTILLTTFDDDEVLLGAGASDAGGSNPAGGGNHPLIAYGPGPAGGSRLYFSGMGSAGGRCCRAGMAMRTVSAWCFPTCTR